jgi:MoaA/NifB/PqqE/SkfB family radical SAM enzyme
VPTPYASVDVTVQCPLRCAHCYFYLNPADGQDLPDETFLARLEALRDSRSIDCMLWLGGEPLTRPDLVTRGARLFRRNALFTSGLLPIPEDFPGGVGVSLDGPAPANDLLRGEGSFDKVLENLDGGKDRIFHCTVTRPTMSALRPLASLLHRAGAAGLLVGLYSPRLGETGGRALSAKEQEAVVDELVRLREEYSFVLNTDASLDLMRPENVPQVAARCMYRTGTAVALDHNLSVKQPCSYGPGADCSRCGCSALFLRTAAVDGDAPSRRALSAFFQART